MGRVYFGAKAKAALAKRNVVESELIQATSDNESIVALGQRSDRRLARDWRVVDNAKKGKKFCEHCAWRAPAGSMILHAHHVVPLSCGGADDVGNILVLCPNCHAIAHFVAPRTNLTRRYAGPQTPLELRRWMAAARKPKELKRLQRAYMLAQVTPMLAEMRA